LWDAEYRHSGRNNPLGTNLAFGLLVIFNGPMEMLYGDHEHGERTQFQNMTYFTVQHSKFAMKLGVCSIVRYNNSP
jgi:hypothetical protein